MRTSTSEGKHGIQWTARSQLDDLDFADDLALLSHTHEQMQTKTASVAAVSASIGLSIHKGKTKVLKFKAQNSNPITLDGETLEDVESFTYLGSIIDEQGGSDADVKARIGKTRATFLQLNNIQTQNNCQPVSKSESPIRTSRRPYYVKLKSEELLQPSSKSIYKYLSTQDTQHPLTGYHQQQPFVGENKPDSR
ncbi:unnamed protein product [Schistosoma margrebowiei]|uniref:Uncharacterized protein n=1 Tax=Schistosoma margrebowiei TaxID=48269 RepID=A0A183LRI7_9TREM|nr:unnamed protein product [Schistosoma margrebowiei]